MQARPASARSRTAPPRAACPRRGTHDVDRVAGRRVVERGVVRVDLVVQHRGADRPRLAQQVLPHNHDRHAGRTDVLLRAAVDDLPGARGGRSVSRRRPTPRTRTAAASPRTPYLDTSTGLEKKLEDMSAIRTPSTTGSDCGQPARQLPAAAQPAACGGRALNSTPWMVSLAQMCTNAPPFVSFQLLCAGMSAREKCNRRRVSTHAASVGERRRRGARLCTSPPCPWPRCSPCCTWPPPPPPCVPRESALSPGSPNPPPARALFGLAAAATHLAPQEPVTT